MTQPYLYIIRLTLLEVPPKRLGDASRVFWKEASEERFFPVRQFLLLEAEHGLPTGGEVVRARDRIPVPQGVISRLLNQPVPLLTLAKRFRGDLRVMDVLNYANAVQRLPLGVANHSGGYRHPADTAVLANVPFLVPVLGSLSLQIRQKLRFIGSDIVRMCKAGHLHPGQLFGGVTADLAHPLVDFDETFIKAHIGHSHRRQIESNPKILLVQFARCNVGHRAHHPNGSARFIPNGFGARTDPYVTFILAANSDLDVVGAALFEVQTRRLRHCLHILRMDARKKPGMLVRRLPFGEAERLFPLRGKKSFTRLDTHIEKTVARGFCGERITLFALAKHLFHSLSIGDIDEHIHRAV